MTASVTAPLLDIVIPVYREEKSILPVIRSLQRTVTDPHRLVFVYDDPADPTLEVIASVRQEFPNHALVHNTAGGYVPAILAGFRAARAPYVCLVTADGSDRAEDIPIMMKKAADGYDMVLGSRYVPGGEKRGGPLAMNVLSRWGNAVFHRLSGFPFRDMTTSFRLIARRIIEQIELTSSVGGALYLELTVKAQLRGFRLTEVPTVWIDRTEGTSKFRLFRWLPGCLWWFLWGIAVYRLGRRPR